jgi:hypothetical protein
MKQANKENWCSLGWTFVRELWDILKRVAREIIRTGDVAIHYTNYSNLKHCSNKFQRLPYQDVGTGVLPSETTGFFPTGRRDRQPERALC